jgi:predicted SAM-dependent methyltransferase
MQYIDRILSVDMVAFEELNVDAVISNFVINILSKQEQGQMALNIAKNLKINGYLLIEIKKDKKKLYNYYQEKNLDNLFIPLGFNRLGFIKNSVSMAGIYQKVETFPLN